MTRPRQLLLLVVAFVLLGACTSLPEYAAPKLVAFDEIDTGRVDSISYRQLQRSDFRGDEPPGSFDERMAAVTCAYIEPLIDSEAIEIKNVLMQDGSKGYSITLHNMKFRALMDRECSWWNPAVDELREEYILAHEQIHFALFEVAAREWTEAPPLQMQFKAEERDVMIGKVREQFERSFDERMAGLMQQNYEFDRQTSVGYDPLKQQKWADKVKNLLEATAETGRAISAAGFDFRGLEEDENE